LGSIEFDALIAVLRKSDPENYHLLFDTFTKCNPTKECITLLNIANRSKINAIFTTNFDLTVEGFADALSIKVRPYTSVDEFPIKVIPSYPLPYFKLHGSVSEGGEPFGRHLENRLKLSPNQIPYPMPFMLTGNGPDDRLTIFRSIFTSMQGPRIRISEEYAGVIQGFGVCDTRIFLVKLTAFCISSPVFRVQGFSVVRPKLYNRSSGLSVCLFIVMENRN